MLAARLGQNGNALRYLDTAMNGNPIQTVVRAYQSPAFREIRLSGEGDELAARMADKARVAFGTPIPDAGNPAVAHHPRRRNQPLMPAYGTVRIRYPESGQRAGAPFNSTLIVPC